MNVIEIKNLNFGYEEPILKDINLTVKKGEFISIIGPNGAGKSTLIKCICPILKPYGSINILGKSKDKYSSKDLAKIISYVPQINQRELNFTCKDFVLMARYPYSKPFSSLTKEDYEICNKAMEITGTKIYENRLMINLSGGERQKVLIASSIAQEAKIALLDEPTSFLDPKHMVQVMNIIKKYNEKAAILTVTHDLNSIFCGNKVIAIKKGRIAFMGTPWEFYENKCAEDIFDTKFKYIKEQDKKYIIPEY